ncbi:calcium-binding protein CML38-like [Salvia divinorum]|uniref:Calcium-binding protein CML38-like n=1 Tax=Salvia divinorum TaxID=28513 RepID=A0ABD1G8C8_SALDI
MKACTAYCKKVFNSFDEDRDGKITPSQLQSCLAMMGGGLSTEEAEMVAQPLLSGGLVGLAEFAGLVEGDGEEEKREDLRKAFEMYKNEGEECITPRSLKNMLGRFGEWSVDECVAMINKFDVNGDGVLCFQEFQLMMIN